MNKPIGLFLGTKQGIDNAYSAATKKELNEHLLMIDECFCNLQFENEELPKDKFRDVEYIFSTWNMATLSEEKIDEYFPSLRAVFYAAGTVQYFAKPYLNRGIKIFSAWGANAVPVAETTVAQIILANKGYFQTVHRGEEGGWYQHDAGKPYIGNFNTDVGIIGAGMIGKLVIEMLKSYKLNVLVFDPFLPDETAEKLGVKKVGKITELFERCSVVSNHLANNPQTENMIDKSCFEKMSRNAVFINTGRGKQVNESDMIAALKECPERVALLDVTWPEPPEEGSELYSMKNVFLSPHLAGSIGNEIQRMGEYMLGEFLALESGMPTKYEVTPKMLETMA